MQYYPSEDNLTASLFDLTGEIRLTMKRIYGNKKALLAERFFVRAILEWLGSAGIARFYLVLMGVPFVRL